MAKFQSQIFVLVVLTLFHYFDQFVLNLSFLVAQMIKNLPAMQKTWIQSLGGENSMEKGMATHFSILA